MSFLTGPGSLNFQRLAVPAATILIIVLAYGSQWLFHSSPDLAPGRLTPKESRVFNTLLVCLWWTYWKACTVDPGRYEIPRSQSSKKGDGKTAAAAAVRKGAEGKLEARKTSSSSEDEYSQGEKHGRAQGDSLQIRRRWCRKCAAPKPPRAHHCKICRRCIPKMDHHCPWTGNCVSLQTFPHFVRFVVYTNISLWTLNYFLLQRFYGLWETRDMPAYLGPTLGQLMALATLGFVSFLTTAALGIILLTTVRGWALNMTMIEGWEVDRHEAVLQRGGGYAAEDWWRSHSEEAEANDASPGTSMAVDPIEFPYDIGIFENMAQAMGTWNPLLWLLPFAGGPRVAALPSSETTTAKDLAAKLSGATKGAEALGTGWYYEENELNDREGMWPPVDPDKVREAQLRRRQRQEWRAEKQRRQQLQQQKEQYIRESGIYNSTIAISLEDDDDFADKDLSPEERKAAFRRRAEEDALRRRRQPRSGAANYDENDDDDDDERNILRNTENTTTTKPLRWINADGERLGDYGVDEDAEDDYEDVAVDVDVDVGVDASDDPVRLHLIGGRGKAGREEEDGEEEEDDNIPLGVLLRRRKAAQRHGGEDDI